MFLFNYINTFVPQQASYILAHVQSRAIYGSVTYNPLLKSDFQVLNTINKPTLIKTSSSIKNN